jgi:hypothetical protein
MAKASIAINSSDESQETSLADDALSLFFAALADVGMSDKEAAYTMAMDPAQLSRVKNGAARLPFDAMWRLPSSFWIAFRARLDAAKHLTETHAREVKAARIGELVRLLVEIAV